MNLLKVFLVFKLIIFFAFTLSAESGPQDESVHKGVEDHIHCSMTPIYQEYGFDELSFSIAHDSLEEWIINTFYPLYEIPYPSEVFYSIRPHLKDTDKNFIEPTEFQFSHLKFGANQIFVKRGRITYVGIVPKTYSYRTQILGSNELLISIKVYLKNSTEQEHAKFKRAFEQAQRIWNDNKVDFGFTYSFNFELVKDPKDAFFKVKLVDNLRGPYDTYWNRNWGSRTVAHEIGHMMGLGDEYQTLTSRSYCLKNSLMCNSWGRPHAQHYYHILRRLFKTN